VIGASLDWPPVGVVVPFLIWTTIRFGVSETSLIAANAAVWVIWQCRGWGGPVTGLAAAAPAIGHLALLAALGLLIGAIKSARAR